MQINIIAKLNDEIHYNFFETLNKFLIQLKLVMKEFNMLIIN